MNGLYRKTGGAFNGAVKVLLVKPYVPARREVICPPLGLLQLAACLREQVSPPPEVQLLDMACARAGPALLRQRLRRLQPDLVGFSAMTFEARTVAALARETRRVSPRARVVVGGPHATAYPGHLLRCPDIDLAVQGEGEETLVELVRRLRRGQDWAGVAGSATRGPAGELVTAPERDPLADLDLLPLPAWDLVSPEAYLRHGDMNGFLQRWPYGFVFTSRACPYRCVYCHRVFGKRFRTRSPASVVAEIRALHLEHGINEIHIIDDVFNWDLPRAKAICRGIIREGLDVSIAFPNGIRGDRMDRELTELLARAGCYSLSFAVETASPRLQRLLKRNCDLARLEQAIADADAAGIIPMGFCMLGFPSESRDELRRTVDFVCGSRLLKAVFFQVVPFPGTELHSMFCDAYPGVLGEADPHPEEVHYHRDPSYNQRATGVRLEPIIRAAYHRFYLDPARLVRILRRFPKNRRLLRGGYHLLRTTRAGGALDRMLARGGLLRGGWRAT